MRPSVKYCIKVLQERLAEIERSGWNTVLAEHNANRIAWLKEGIQILKEGKIIEPCPLKSASGRQI